MYSRPQKLVAEFLGTFALIFSSAGAICADQLLKTSNSPGLGLLGIAAAYGLTMGTMVMAVGHVSGGHLNPAVTIGFWVTRKLSTIDALLYWVAQLTGGVAGAYLLKGIVPEDAWRGVGLGTPELARDFTRTSGMALEGVMTFILVYVVFATTADERGASNRIAGFASGLIVTVDVLVGSPLTGAAMNPARAFGPALASAHWANHGVYWVGPLAGGVLAGWLYDTVYLKKA